VAVVNARQVREFAKATGQLAKSDRIDAGVVCSFARAIRPAARPMKEALTAQLDDLVTRRRQLVEMRVQEMLRLQGASTVQAKSLKAHIVWLNTHQIDRDRSGNALAQLRRLAGQRRRVAEHSGGG
jgi:transposase